MSDNKNIKKSLVSAKTRVIVAALVVVGVAGGVVALWHHHRAQVKNQAVVAVAGGPNIASVPGAGNPSDRYVKTQNLQNALQAEKARKAGTSAIPTITRPSFVGSPDAFGTLPDATSTGSTTPKFSCPISKVVVMFKPNPSSCTVANLKLARQTGVTAEELLCQGCSCPALKLAGYTVGELKNIGFTAKQLHHCGFTLGQLVEAGFSAKQLKDAGFNSTQLANAGFSAGQLAAAGFSPSQIKAAGYTAAELKAAGIASANCNVAALRKAREQGASAASLKKSGCGLAALKAAGFTAAQLRKAGYSATALKNAGFSNAALKAAGFTAAQIKVADSSSKACSVAALKKARASGASALQLRNKGCGLAALKAAGFTATQLKSAGFTAAQLKKAGYSAADLKAAGFTAAQLKAAGYSAAALKKAGFSAAALKAAGFSAGQLKAAGYSAKQLESAGYTAKQLHNAGFNAAALRAAGFSAKALRSAGFSKGDLLRAGFSPKQAGYASAKAATQVRKKQVSAADKAASIASKLNNYGDNVPANILMPSSRDAAQAARLAAIVRQQQQQMSAQQRQDSMQQVQGAMTMEANRIVDGWNVHSAQTMQKGTPPETTMNTDAGMPGGMAGVNGLGSTGGKIVKAGSILFAVLDTSINSDERSPILATIVAGPMKGSKLLGRFARVNKRLLLSFSLLNDPHYKKSISINAVAIDPNTARTAISGQVNNHYLLRYGTLFASAFMSGISKAIIQSNSTQNCSLFGCVHTVNKLNTPQQITYALGTVGDKYASVMGNNFNTPPTVKIRGGTGIGILIMSDLKLPVASK